MYFLAITVISAGEARLRPYHGDDRMGRLVVHLVHGTWPSGLSLPMWLRSRPPLWFEDGSDFQKAIAGKHGGEVVFVVFKWSGRNSVWARLRAARRLEKRISQTAANEPRTDRS